MTVSVVSANKILDEILTQQKYADIVKIDVEGYENKILGSIKSEILSRVDRIYAETTDDQEILGFSSESYGGLTRYYRI
jgi:FkbM family methyltransferase